MHFYFLIFSIIYPLHAANRVTIHHQEAITEYAAYRFHHVENILKLFKIVTKSIKHCIVCKFSDYIKRFFFG